MLLLWEVAVQPFKSFIGIPRGRGSNQACAAAAVFVSRLGIPRNFNFQGIPLAHYNLHFPQLSMTIALVTIVANVGCRRKRSRIGAAPAAAATVTTARQPEARLRER